MLQLLDRNAERWALIYFYSFLVILMVTEVLRRELFQFNTSWGEEVAKASFVYLVWIGSAAAVRDRSHIRIDVIFNNRSNRGKIILYLIGDVVMFGVSIFGLISSFHPVLLSIEKGSVFEGLGISRAWYNSAVPIGFALMIFRLTQNFIRDIRDYQNNSPVYEGEKMFD